MQLFYTPKTAQHLKWLVLMILRRTNLCRPVSKGSIGVYSSGALGVFGELSSHPELKARVKGPDLPLALLDYINSAKLVNVSRVLYRLLILQLNNALIFK